MGEDGIFAGQYNAGPRLPETAGREPRCEGRSGNACGTCVFSGNGIIMETGWTVTIEQAGFFPGSRSSFCYADYI